MKPVRVLFIYLYTITTAFCDVNYTANFHAIQSNMAEYCQTCHEIVSMVLRIQQHGATKESMRALLLGLCDQFSHYDEFACKGYIEIELDTLIYIMANKSDLTPERVCATYLQKNGCKDPGAKRWEVPLPPYRGKGVDSKYKKDDSKKLHILHLTDLHYDPYYKAGSEAKCDKPLCCQDNAQSVPKHAAGFWGDYNVCDMPRRSLDNLLQHIQQEHLDDVDFIYFTGDIMSHRSWDTSREKNAMTIEKIFNLLAITFENKTVYPILGNHEPHPTDFYSSDDILQDPFSTRWIFNLSMQSWSRWLPATTHATIQKGGYYSVLVKPGFKIIALNSNVCFTSNLWLLYQDEDPYEQLKWLVNELYKSEKRNEKVHILSHIPPGEILCHRQWSNQFRKIVERFSGTIAAQFNGHTHQDEFRVFYNPRNSSEVINVAFNGGSFTTFVGHNPNYRIYQVSPTNAAVENYDQFIYNLTKANLDKSKPDWYKLYSFKEAYNLTDLGLPSFGRLLDKLSNNNELLFQYFRFLVKNSDVYIKEGCDDACLKKYLCLITAVEADISLKC